MRIVFFIICLSVFSAGTYAQKIKPIVKGKLPGSIRESSGIAKAGNEIFLTINDSGGENCVYEINQEGMLLKKIFVQVSNHDWEDLCMDDSFHLYIGDVGSNTNRRKDLSILKTELLQGSGYDSANVSIISFRYPDQKEFPPLPVNWNYDCEAFLHIGDSLISFQKIILTLLPGSQNCIACLINPVITLQN